MLIDDVTIRVQGGKGGDGDVAFNKQKMALGPTGSNGGMGGAVYFVGTSNLSALQQFQYKKEVKAEEKKVIRKEEKEIKAEEKPEEKLEKEIEEIKEEKAEEAKKVEREEIKELQKEHPKHHAPKMPAKPKMQESHPTAPRSV